MVAASWLCWLVVAAVVGALEVEVDGSASSAVWASVGLSLNDGKESATVEVLVGEDSVHAALRFAYFVRGINPDIGFAVRVAEIVEERLVKMEDTAERAAALAANNCTILKTAGKHLKRAEDAAGDDRHLSAAADYVRASRRSGIERDRIDAFRANAKDEMADEVPRGAAIQRPFNMSGARGRIHILQGRSER